MSSGGWPELGPRHGKHRHGSVNSAWTPAVRPSEAGHLPAHARLDFGPPSIPPPAPPLRTRTPQPPPSDDDTAPLALVPRPREEDVPVVHVLTDTPPRGLRKFDLGSVPASVTPPRSWRKAAWFTVGTSAAVVCGLAVAAVRFVGTPIASDTIHELPAYPTQQLEIEKLPVDETSTDTDPTTRSSNRPSTSSTPGRPDTARRTSDMPAPGSPSSDEPGTSAPGSSGGDSTTLPTQTAELRPPPRTTVGPAPVTPTNPQEMGDTTEEYFRLVTDDPQAAHDLCTGGMAREGPEGIEARYEGVDRVEVQDITIDRNQAVTTSTVKIVRDDGTETVEQRQLTFTWGGNPKITDDATAG
ncbi:MAG: hypothetical protein GEV28_32030 [Actinophytocola sp.]|uniref:hypothetical protein n=1 Tax=Actinophytocola sp. TaxID=1872138 RepID=UPI001324B176|nr:hypothetical protein [Actinophytocola sp.]MPZ84765.1 hypothetical protein [Actinophytocola sp.]